MSEAATGVAHRTHGRVRVKVKKGKRNPERLRETAEQLRALPGVERVEINEITGSVVVYYDVDRHDEFDSHFERHMEVTAPPKPKIPETEIDKMANVIEAEAEYLAEHSIAARTVYDFCKKLDREIKVASGNNIDLKLVFAGGVVGVTVLEIGAAAATPVWVTLALFGVNHLVELHQKSAAKGSAPAGAG